MRLGRTVLIAVVVSVVGSCSSDSQHPLIQEYPDSSGGGLGFPSAVANKIYSFDDATLCLTGKGEVIIEDVELANPSGGLTIQRFSTRPSNNRRGLQLYQSP